MPTRSRSRQAFGEGLKRVIGLALCACIVSCALAPVTLPENGVDEASASINANDMLRHIQVLASDEFEGRAPASRGEQRTVDYLVGEFRRIGLKPGNADGTYVQNVSLVGGRPKGEWCSKWGTAHRARRAGRLPKFARWQLPDVRVDAVPLVFVGHGVVAPEFDWDDFKDVDVRGKALLVLPNDPQAPDPLDPSKLDASLFGGAAVTFYAKATTSERSPGSAARRCASTSSCRGSSARRPGRSPPATTGRRSSTSCRPTGRVGESAGRRRHQPTLPPSGCSPRLGSTSRH